MKLVICGDVSLQGSNDAFVNGDVEPLFHDVPAVFKEADRVLINLECALTEQNTPIDKKGPNIKGSPKCAKVLKEVGVTDCGLSNNHIFDFGYPGIKDTIEAMEAYGFGYTGFGKNYEDSRRNMVMEFDGKSIAIIAVCEHEYCYALENRAGARPFDPYDTLEDIRDAKAKHDFVIVTYHGGKEQSLYPSPRLVKACRAMIKFGADVVLCQHTHCIGCYEQFQGGHILYGQGNFHFTCSKHADHPHWQSGLIANLDINDKVDIEFIPVKVVGVGIELAKGEDYDRIMGAFHEQSENLKNGDWIKYWDQFCQESVDRYIGNLTRAYKPGCDPVDIELFNGRMHCEAHKDVIDWLCKHPWEDRAEP